MANPIADAIRRIVGYDPTQSSLGPNVIRKPLSGAVSIGYMLPDKSAAGNKSGAPGTKYNPDKDNPDGVKKPPGGDPKANESGGNEVDPKDPNKAIYEAGDGEHSGKSLIEDQDVKESDSLPSGVGGVLLPAQGGGTVNAITDVYDCETGIGLEIREDGMFRPPPGWENAETPPGDGPADHWELGVSWFAPGFPAGNYANNPLSAATASKNAVFPEYTQFISEVFDGAFPHPGGVRRYIYTWEKPLDPLHDQVSFYAQDESCTPVDGDIICPTTNPASPTKWPADGKMQLKRLPNGNFVRSDFEPDEDIIMGLGLGNSSTIRFCYEGTGGEKTGERIPTDDGGWMVYQHIAGVAQGVIKVFGPDNRVRGYTDAAGMSAYLPAPAQVEE